MTNVNVAATKVSPLGGATLGGITVVYATAAKAAQNDTVTITNVSEILVAQVMVDDGSTTDWPVDTFTREDATKNLLNLTGATTGTVHIMAIVRV